MQRMLAVLSGATHIVITGICVEHRVARFHESRRDVGRPHAQVDQGRDRSICRLQCVAGKGGGFGIQDPDPFVTNHAGSHTNIVGLPMEITMPLLAEAGIKPRRDKIRLVQAPLESSRCSSPLSGGITCSTRERPRSWDRSRRSRPTASAESCRVNAIVMLLMAVGIATATFRFEPDRFPREWAITWVIVASLLLLCVVLGLIDLRLTMKLRHQLRERRK